MPILIGLILKAIFETVRVLCRKARELKPEPLCANCIHAHVQYGTNARRAISCVYGGTIRPIKLDVLYCTDYQTRNPPVPTRAIGFVHEIVPAE